MSTDTQVAIEAGDTLENLVNQFTDPYACLRELIQNSLDAGSSSIEVWFEYNPTEKKDEGMMIIHLDDTGEGMTRRIIDTKLTQLFSSNKEDDLTKVGKFGIGFVSVFALDPGAVIVDTGRDGEYWRLIFKADRKFDRVRLNHPVEGTQIQIVKIVSEAEYKKAIKRSVDTIRYWCKHVDVEITVDGNIVNEEFLLGHQHQYSHEENETKIVVAPTHEPSPFFGFYNRGLTLKEGESSDYHSGVSFKVSSRYLEHTLTRDNVITDKHYDKAMALLKNVVDGPFRRQLFERASKSLDYELFGHLAARFGRKLPSEYQNMPLLPTADGERVTLKSVKKSAKKHGMVLYAAEGSTLTKRITEEKSIPVLLWKGPEVEPGLERLIHKLTDGRPLQPAEEIWAAPEVLDRCPENTKRLLAEAAKLMRKLDSPYRDFIAADFGKHSSGMADQLYYEQVDSGALVYVPEENKPRSWKNFLIGFARGKYLLVNVTHPLIEPHFQLYLQRPVLAAYLLTKAILINDGLNAETESKLLSAALEMDK